MASQRSRAGRGTRTPSPARLTANAGVPAADGDYPALVRAASEGDRAAMERLLTRAQAVAWRFSTLVCGHPEDAEDAMQDALVTTYRQTATIRQPEAFRAWLYRTVKNACLMRRRTRAGEPRRLLSLDDRQASGEGDGQLIDPPSPGRTPEDLAMDRRLRARLKRAIRGLPAPYRMVLFLRDMEGLSTREVAAIVGTSEANVKQRLHRARLLLRKALHD
jgi:RNA polymerase sigma-70 factor (ECF subfamily)